MVNVNQEENEKDLKDHKDRLTALENQVDMLKALGAPKGEGGNPGAGLLDTLNDITDKMRKEFDDKMDNLLKRIEALEKESRDKDNNL